MKQSDRYSQRARIIETFQLCASKPRTNVLQFTIDVPTRSSSSFNSETSCLELRKQLSTVSQLLDRRSFSYKDINFLELACRLGIGKHVSSFFLSGYQLEILHVPGSHTYTRARKRRKKKRESKIKGERRGGVLDAAGISHIDASTERGPPEEPRSGRPSTK